MVVRPLWTPLFLAMADIDFITTYVPDFSELTQEELYETRARLANFIQVKFDDLDLNPNTVVGDLIVTPQTYTISALEHGLGRFMSDLDLGNVANDVIWNCDFVAAYLKNFGVETTASLKPSGVARLVFTQDKEYILDRGVKFSFGDAAVVFSIYLPNLGAFRIYPVGTIMPSGVNGAVLKDSGSGVYFADVPLVGDTGALTEDIVQGTSGLISVEIPELGAISALVDFDRGEDASSLPELAKRARTTIYSASLNTRTGAIRYLDAVCPFVESKYAIHNGDREMLRTYHNPYGAATGCMDVYVRSKQYAFVEEQNVRLYLSDDGTAFEGPFEYTGQPYYIESITHPDVAASNLEHTISSTNSSNLGALAAYSTEEHLMLSVPAMTKSSGDFVFNTSINDDGRIYADFTVRYHTDPMFSSIAQTLENEDYRPINTSILVRGFIPVIISQFEVEYVREPGVIPLLDEARDAIKAYFSSLGAPDVYSDAEIARIMGEAGAKYVSNLNVNAYVQWSVGTHIMNYSGEMVEVPKTPVILSSKGLRVSYPDRDILADDMYACSVRNVRYYMLENALTFKEVKEI